MTTEKNIAKNLILSLVAQSVSLAVSFVLGFIVPKFIDEYQYAYWQTFLLYLGYVGLLHFGLLDGLVLRYSQYDYEELDKDRFRSQFQFLLLLTSLFCLIGIVLSGIFIEGVNGKVIALVSIGILTKNIFTYASFTFQITNQIGHYATLTILQRAIFVVIVGILLLAGVNDFVWYCLAELIGDLVGIVFGLFFNKKLYFGKGLSVRETFKEAKRNVVAGMFIVLAHYSANFIIGGAKLITQWRWGELLFGKVAFSFSLTNIFLTFITAMSIVLFPSLKRMKEDELPKLYDNINNAISPLLFLALFVYFPLCWILKYWLPNYSTSLVYLGVLLPISIFTSKLTLLTNNYLKAYRKEKAMLIVNMVAVAFGFGFALLSAYVFNDLDILLFSVVFIVMLRSFVSEIIVRKVIGKNEWMGYAIEFVMTVVFIVAARYLSLWIGCMVYAIAFLLYVVFNRKNILPLFVRCKKFFCKKN